MHLKIVWQGKSLIHMTEKSPNADWNTKQIMRHYFNQEKTQPCTFSAV